MNNPVAQSAYSLAYVADYLNMKPTTLREKVIDYPHCFPPYAFLGRTKQQDGVIVFPRNLFERWLEDNAHVTELPSTLNNDFAEHA